MGKQKVVNGQGWPSCDVWASKTTECQRSPDKDLNVGERSGGGAESKGDVEQGGGRGGCQGEETTKG